MTKKAARITLLAHAAGEHAAIAELEDDGLALRLLVQVGGKRAHAGVLVGERKARFALVRRKQVETLEFENVAPAACHLAVGDAVGAGRNGLGESRNRPPIENAVAEIAEHYGARRRAGEIVHDLLGLDVGDAAIVERVDLEQAVVAAHISVLVRGRPGVIDDRQRLHAGIGEVLKHEVLQGVVAEDGREGDLGAGGAQVLGDDGGAADEVDAAVEAHARRRRLGHAADHGRIRQAVDDGVADDMDFEAFELLHDLTQLGKAESLGLHQRDQFLHRDIGRPALDQVRRGIDDVARRKQNLAAVALQGLDLLLGLRIDAVASIFVALGEIIRLQPRNILKRRRIGIDDDVIDHFQRGEIERAQVLRDERAIARLGDVRVRGQAGDQNIRLLLGVDQVTDMARDAPSRTRRGTSRWCARAAAARARRRVHRPS